MSKEIEKVNVNGMTMYKWGNQIFLTEGDAQKAITDSKRNIEALQYGYIQETCDPIELLIAGEILRGIKL